MTTPTHVVPDPAAEPARPSGMALDEVTLVARARDGDVHAFEQLVRRYQGPMFGLAKRMLSSRGDAEDVVQEVFLTAWRRLGQLQDDAAFVGWLYRTTTNRCLNVIRSRKPTAEVELDGFETTGPTGRPERAAETNEQMTALSAALEQLPAAQRACWLLREVHGRSYDEIAEATGATNAAVRGRIARARAQLMEVMAPWR